MLKFTKMQGLGNDYVYVDALTNHFPETTDWSKIAKYISPRRFSIGSDGLIVILPSSVAHCRMLMFNVDGSIGEMCGNGIRCLAKYYYEHIAKHNPLTVETLAGVLELTLTIKEGLVTLIRVNMGRPRLKLGEIPMTGEPQSLATNIELQLENGDLYLGTGVNLGNPHFVIEVLDVDHFPVEKIGPLIENHPRFPHRANIEFISVLDRKTIKMRVWERGSGETWACGTGACASTITARLQDKADAKVTVKLRGGDLFIEWPELTSPIFMTGPAVEVYSGFIKIPFLDF